MLLRFLRLFRMALWRGFQHDVFTTARAAAYYAILTLFPALMVLAAVVAGYETIIRIGLSLQPRPFPARFPEHRNL